MTAEAVFLVLILSGVFALLASVLLTRLYWRPDIPPYGRATRFLDVTLHPERYVGNAPLRAIRTLAFVGALLMACAAAIVAKEIVHVSR